MPNLEALTVSDFEPLLHQRFRIADSFDAELVEVTENPREPGGRAPFSLVFEGVPNPPLSQGIYSVQHDDLGMVEIFLVPIAADRYQAVFT
jgi:Domain of unknown function (DUF6916)